jgi:hypothetical protein
MHNLLFSLTKLAHVPILLPLPIPHPTPPHQHTTTSVRCSKTSHDSSPFSLSSWPRRLAGDKKISVRTAGAVGHVGEGRSRAKPPTASSAHHAPEAAASNPMRSHACDAVKRICEPSPSQVFPYAPSSATTGQGTRAKSSPKRKWTSWKSRGSWPPCVVVREGWRLTTGKGTRGWPGVEGVDSGD